MTSRDLRWPFPVPLSVNGTWAITDKIICHNTERIEWFWLAYSKQDACQYFTIPLGMPICQCQCIRHANMPHANMHVMQRSRFWPELRSQIQELWDIQIMHTGTVMNTCREEIAREKKNSSSDVIATPLRWDRQSRSGDLTWLDPNIYLAKMCTMNM